MFLSLFKESGSDSTIQGDFNGDMNEVTVFSTQRRSLKMIIFLHSLLKSSEEVVVDAGFQISMTTSINCL